MVLTRRWEKRNKNNLEAVEVVKMLLMRIWFRGIKTCWDRKLYMKTWYSTKSLWILSIFRTQNVSIPPYHILLRNFEWKASVRPATHTQILDSCTRKLQKASSKIFSRETCFFWICKFAYYVLHNVAYLETREKFFL